MGGEPGGSENRKSGEWRERRERRERRECGDVDDEDIDEETSR